MECYRCFGDYDHRECYTMDTGRTVTMREIAGKLAGRVMRWFRYRAELERLISLRAAEGWTVRTEHVDQLREHARRVAGYPTGGKT